MYTTVLKITFAIIFYRDRSISLGKSVEISGLPMNEFIEHLSSLNIDIVHFDETVANEVADVSLWLSL